VQTSAFTISRNSTKLIVGDFVVFPLGGNGGGRIHLSYNRFYWALVYNGTFSTYYVTIEPFPVSGQITFSPLITGKSMSISPAPRDPICGKEEDTGNVYFSGNGITRYANGTVVVHESPSVCGIDPPFNITIPSTSPYYPPDTRLVIQTCLPLFLARHFLLDTIESQDIRTARIYPLSIGMST
jgi:hypothetical protein